MNCLDSKRIVLHSSMVKVERKLLDYLTWYFSQKRDTGNISHYLVTFITTYLRSPVKNRRFMKFASIIKCSILLRIEMTLCRWYIVEIKR